MTHVLDRMIEEVEALAGALRRRDQNTLGGKTSNSERELYESAEESLRILRAEREGKHASPCVRRSLGGRRRAVCAYLADGTKVRVARSDHTKGPAWLEVVPTERLTLAESVNDEADSVNDAGSSVNDGRADELRAEREGTRAEDEGVYGSTRGRFVTPVLARLEEARAEGRREERERVVAWLNKRSEEAPSGPPYGGGPEEYMVLDGVAACIEDGDHWRGGESP